MSLTANIGLATVPENTQSGANGITFLYSQTIAASSNGPTLVSIVAVVNSTNASTPGAFNTINLTDSTGNSLNFTPLSGNSGNGLSDLTHGQIVTFLLSIPNGTTNYQFYAQTMKNGAAISQGNVANPINLSSYSSGILVVKPTGFNLYARESYTSQIITYSNIGDATITNLDIATPQGPFTLTKNCGSSLAPGASCTATLVSNASPGIGGSESLIATSSVGSTTSQFNYAGANPIGSVEISAINNFIFVANTMNTSTSTQLTIKNNGNVSESNFTFAFTGGGNQYFNISSDSASSACILSNNDTTISGPLDPGTSCTLILTYTNPTVDSGTPKMTVNYYANGSAVTPATSKDLTYSTTAAYASLSLVTSQSCTSESCNLGTIITNGIDNKTQSIKIINNGPANAINIANEPISGDSTYFQVSTTGCNSTLAAGESCMLSLQFGPNNTPISTVSAVLPIKYDSAGSGATPSSPLNIGLFGIARSPLTANPVISSVVFTPTQGVFGNGESAGSTYELESSDTTSTMTLTYTNTGSYAANNFAVVGSAPSGYTQTGGTCGNTITTLDPNKGNSCTVTYGLNAEIPGLKNFDLTVLNGTWTDEAGNHSQIISWQVGATSLSAIYVNIYPAPVVTAVLSSTPDYVTPVGDIKVYKPFYVYFTLSGGYQVPDITNTVSVNGNLYGNCIIPTGKTACSVPITLINTASATITTTTSPLNIKTNTSAIPNPINPLGRYAYVMSTVYAGSAHNAKVDRIYILPYDASTGNLSEATSFQELPGVPQTIASPLDGKYLYTNIINNGTIQILCYTVNSATGVLTPVPENTITVANATGSTYNSLKFAPSGKYVYIIYNTTGSNGEVAVYSYDSSNGKLTATGSTALAVGITSLDTITFTPNAKYAYISNKGGNGSIYMYSVDSTTGAITALNPASAASPTGSYPGASVVDPSGKYLYVANPGGNMTPTTMLSVFDINASNGQLTQHSPNTVTTDLGPTAVIFDPTGSYLYTANYAAGSYQAGNLSMFSWQVNGNLNSLSPATIASNGGAPASFAIDPSQKYLYAVNAFNYTIQQYTFNPGSGVLSTSTGVISITGSTAPSGLAGYIIFGN